MILIRDVTGYNIIMNKKEEKKDEGKKHGMAFAEEHEDMAFAYNPMTRAKQNR